VYVAAVGQPGPRYTGHTMLVAPTGDVVAELVDTEQVAEAPVERRILEDARSQNPSLANRRL